ncbi:MAG: prepilin-type N-terminal cleavage/methylation domain-containing protein [Actinomycetota bacterium]|nr:prepilin-type N-terminal cleavage/methylation domain-containing protein [Actinomycetota bacterium]
MTRARQAGLTLIETLVAITIFSIITVGLVPLLGTAMSGGATTRSESVARNVTSKALERLRGLQYHVAHSSTPRKVDLLDHFFPGQTPAFVASVGTGYDAATQTYVTTCDSTSATAACRALPGQSQIPNGFLVEVRATFRTPTNPAVTQSVPAAYAWDAPGGADAPPSELLEVKITTAWSVGTRARTFELRSYLGARARSALPSGGGATATPPPSGSGAAPPATVKLRAEGRIDYGYEMTATYQDNSSPPKLQDYTGTLGTAVAYGEQLDSGSKAELSVRAGRLHISRAPDPAVSGDTGVEVIGNGAAFNAAAPPDAATTAVTTAAETYTNNPETPIMTGWLGPSEAGTLSGSRGAGPTVAGGLPFVKGYYDINATTAVSPASSWATHMWMMPQVANTSSGTETTTNPLNHYPGTTKKTITISDSGVTGPAYLVDPRGEVSVDSTPTSPASGRVVTASATIPVHGQILLFPPNYTSSNHAYLRITHFDASVSCAARADASAASTATGSWSATLEYYSFEGTSTKDDGYRLRATTLPTQTRTDNPHVPQGTTNPLQAIRNLNGGNGPKIWDTDGAFGNSTYDVYLFAGNGKRGLLTGWSQAAVETSISSDDRVAEARLNGAIRMEGSPVWGPWPNPSTGQVSQKPQSDFTFAMGKLSCKAEDYR